MYNIIIQSKYKNVYIIGITCFFILLVMNSTNIVEGARNKKKETKKEKETKRQKGK